MGVYYALCIGKTFLDGACFVAAAVILGLTIARVSRANDPARSMFLPVKIGLGLLALGSLLGMITAGMGAWYLKTDDITSTVENVANAIIYLTNTSLLILHFTDGALFMALHLFDNGIRVVKSGHGLSKWFKIPAYIIAGVMPAGRIAAFAMELVAFQKLQGADVWGGSSDDFWEISNLSVIAADIKLGVAVLTMVAALALVVRSIMASVNKSKKQYLSSATKTFIIASIFWLIRTIYDSNRAIQYWGQTAIFDDSADWAAERPIYTITDSIFGPWFLFGSLTLLYSLGKRPRNGLWSVDSSSNMSRKAFGFAYNTPSETALVQRIEQ